MQSLENKENFGMTVQVHAERDRNESASGREIDTPLTQQRSPTVLRDLIVKRNRVRRDTSAGQMLSNLIEQRAWLADPDPRPWVSHPLQTVRGLMQWQVDQLQHGER